MPIIFACHECGQPYKRPSKDAGKKARCAKCEAELIVPAATQERVAAAVAGQPVSPKTTSKQWPLVGIVGLVGGGVIASGLLLFFVMSGGDTGEPVLTEARVAAPHSVAIPGPTAVVAAKEPIKPATWAPKRTTKRYKPPKITGRRPTLGEVTERLTQNQRESGWQFTAVADSYSATEAPSDIEVQIHHGQLPILIAVAGPVEAARAVIAVIGPADLDTPEGKHILAEGIKVLSMAGGAPIRDVTKWFKKNRQKIQSGETLGNFLDRSQWHLAASSSRYDDGEVRITATISFKKPEPNKTKPKNGFAKIERNFIGSSSWADQAPRSYRQESGVSVLFSGPEDRPTSMLITYDSENTKARDMASAVWLILPGLCNSGGADYIHNRDLINAWARSVTPELRLRGGVLRVTVLGKQAVIRISER